MISVTYPISKTNSPDIAFFNDPNSEYYLKLAKNNPGDVVVQGPLISPRNHQVLVYNRQAVYVMVSTGAMLDCVLISINS